MERWTIEDLNHGRCDLEDLGNAKPSEPEPLPDPVAAIDLTDVSLRERLRDDALKAYVELGGPEYLKRNPELLDKILAKSVVPDPVGSTVNVKLPIMPWITARRLLYRESLQLADDIKVKDSPADPPKIERDRS